ncbi:hypothetical protein DICVIV_12861 [Dictyocaulus viviparus]|uniref:DUF7596 domain-containing protein n=1 Tax=Dictyocaulus viviparus TaxID=29172 RepID=A0A0D8XBM8_DICVI|nr:hypothetical protein DICVIV_12861 [Dictyocaulus viviparus]
MLSTASIASLTKATLANDVLDGRLLPINNNAAFIAHESVAVTVTIVDYKDTVIACGIVTPFSAKQAYCLLGKVDESYENQTIWIEELPKERKELRVHKTNRTVSHIIDRTAPTLFETVFADHDGRSTFSHLIDALIDCSVGKSNVELGKNLTVDLLIPDESSREKIVKQWRDAAGFIVSDKNRFFEVLIDRLTLLSLCEADSQIAIVDIGKENLLSVLDYDAKVSVYDRSEHVSALIQTPGISGKLASKDGQPCGYTLVCKDRILLSYADNEETFKQLLTYAAKDITYSQCRMFLILDSHNVTNQILEASIERKAVQRLHTRSNVNGIKWKFVYCSNVGLHIF